MSRPRSGLRRPRLGHRPGLAAGLGRCSVCGTVMAPHAAADPSRSGCPTGARRRSAKSGQAAPFSALRCRRRGWTSRLGYIIENRFIRRACFMVRSIGLPSLTHFLAPCALDSLDWKRTPGSGAGRAWTMAGAWRAPLVVAADGRGSMLRSRAGIKATRKILGLPASRHRRHGRP